MPEVIFTIELPNGEKKRCYSPSTVIRDYFKIGDEFLMSDFVNRSREALTEASERVRAKFGFYCTSASAQVAEIEFFARSQPADGKVRILNI